MTEFLKNSAVTQNKDFLVVCVLLEFKEDVTLKMEKESMC